jgi:hypothetical protein
MRYSITISLALLLFCCTACEDKAAGVHWGKTKYYSDFLFITYKPERMERTLILDFNDDAKHLITNDIVFEITEKDSTGKLVLAKDILVYKNSIRCLDNLLKINSSEKEIQLGIEFTDDAQEGNHTLYLRAKDSEGLDRIDFLVLAGGFCVTKDVIMNPLAKLLMWLVIILVAVCVVWIICLKPMLYPSFKVRSLFVFCPDSPMLTVKIKGCRKVVCSNKEQRQSFINRLFVGKIAYTKNAFWTQSAEIMPKDKRSVRIRLPRGFSLMPSATLSVGEEVEIKDGNNTVTKLKIN